MIFYLNVVKDLLTSVFLSSGQIRIFWLQYGSKQWTQIKSSTLFWREGDERCYDCFLSNTANNKKSGGYTESLK